MLNMFRTMLVVVVATVSLASQERTFKEEIKVSSGQTLDLRLETGGSVRIVGSEETSVSVVALFMGADAGDILVKATPTPDGVEISSAYASPRGNRSSSAEFDIRVPRRFNVRMQTKTGSVSVDDVEGTITGRTMAGELLLSSLRGSVSFSTMAGGIRLTNSEVEGTVSTMRGNVLIDDVAGDVKGSSMSGIVEYRNLRRAVGAAKEIRISTMSGAINLADAMAGANVSTMRGDVEIRSAKPFAKASTMAGDIQLDAVDGWIEARTMAGDITATMVGDPDSGDRHVKLSAWGDVVLSLPESLDMRVAVTLAYTRNSPKNYSIQSDFPVQLRQTSEWREVDESMRRYIYGSGTVGNGTHLVEIETVNGNVTIRRRPTITP